MMSVHRPTLSLTEAAQAMGGEVRGGDHSFGQVTIDSRRVPPGALFVAIPGERFDGHQFAAAAAAAGACGAVVERWLAVDIPQVKVGDARRALGSLAKAWRKRHFRGTLVALTGSNGKTTTKEMLAAILAAAGRVSATRGNLNNDIGVPLTLLSLTPDLQWAVVEMGANHAGEIAYAAALAEPQVALITNAGPAHLEGFGSLDGVARAKGEIYDALGPGGVAVINADDAFAERWHRRAAGKVLVDFGIQRPAQVTGRFLDETQGAIAIAFGGHTVTCRLPLAGHHNLANALAATAAALAAGATLDHVVRGLEGLEPVAGRLRTRRGVAGSTLIDDTYNANPASLQAALLVLKGRPAPRWLVLGDMAELGADARAHHHKVAELARQAGVEALFTTGPLADLAGHAFGAGACHEPDLQALATELRARLQARAALGGAGVTILLKGSRSAGLERLVAALVADDDGYSPSTDPGVA
ncbi:MAG: UDP-N-acetylmuramoyl-tripeptide--D-alanyl-D-alanine ligase [Candidatus Competibacterales bacterium]